MKEVVMRIGKGSAGIVVVAFLLCGGLPGLPVSGQTV
jgi:hypothetical protein